jgi:hypothetical protein
VIFARPGDIDKFVEFNRVIKKKSEPRANFIKSAGPHENKYQTVHIYVRGDAAVVATKDTGKNKVSNVEGRKR